MSLSEKSAESLNRFFNALALIAVSILLVVVFIYLLG